MSVAVVPKDLKTCEIAACRIMVGGYFLSVKTFTNLITAIINIRSAITSSSVMRSPLNKEWNNLAAIMLTFIEYACMQ